jgi:uncharacterized membrane protein
MADTGQPPVPTTPTPPLESFDEEDLTEGFHITLTQGFIERWRGTAEARIFVAGLWLVAILLAEIGLLVFLSPHVAGAVASGVLIENFAGREAGIPVALSGGAPPWLVVQVSTTQDIAVVALAFPLFLYLLHRWHARDNYLMRHLRRIEHAAHRHRRFVTRWGPLGIFLFMMVPFLVNGPLSGAVLGRIAGIPTKYLLLPVVAATALSAFLWTYFFDSLFSIANHFDPRIAPVLTAGIVILLFGSLIVTDLLRERARKAKA